MAGLPADDPESRSAEKVAPGLQGQQSGQDHDAQLQPAQGSSLALGDLFEQAPVFGVQPGVGLLLQGGMQQSRHLGHKMCPARCLVAQLVLEAGPAHLLITPMVLLRLVRSCKASALGLYLCLAA